MITIVSLLKHFLSEVVRKFNVIVYMRTLDEQYRKNADSINKNGYLTIAKVINKDRCKDFIRLIDDHIAAEDCKIWKDSHESDNRIYFINEIHEAFKEIAERPSHINTLKAYLGYRKPVYMVLAARLDAVENNLGSGGGWHRDSPFQHQFKALFYLNDVNETNGPFEFVADSHRFLNCCRAVLQNVLGPNAYRYQENEIYQYASKFDADISPLVGSAGDMAFVDTKLIHRGRPIEQGRRYVLFVYYWDNNIPTQFEKYRQGK